MIRLRPHSTPPAAFARKAQALLCGLLLAILVALAPAAVLAENASPRGAQHEGYGRLVFDWDGPVSFSADVVGNTLVVRFDRSASGDFHRVLKPLARYFRSVSVSPDRKTATFALVRPVTLKTSTSASGSVVIDLADDASAAAPPTEGGKAPVSLLPPSAPGDGAAPSEPKGEAVDVRDGEHGEYNRLAFTWSRAVPYTVNRQGDQAVVAFKRAGRLDAAALKASLPPDIGLASTEVKGNATTVTLDLPKGARLRHFAAGAKVVVDVVRDAHAPAPAGIVPLPATSESVPGQPSLKPLAATAEEPPRLPSESLGAGQAAEAAKAGKSPPPAKPSEPLPPAVGGPTTNAPVPAAAEGEEIFSLSVSWDKPVAAALFERAGYLWLVFDRHEEVDIKLLRRMGGNALTFVEQMKARDATILRFIIQPEFQPSLRRDGLLWVVDLMHQASVPKQPIVITAPAALATGTGISLAVADAGNVVTVADPEVGDAMLVVPVMPLGAGVYPGRDTPDVELLPTMQGVAMVPHLDGLDVKSSRSGVTIGAPGNGGLRLSHGLQPEAASPEGTELLDVKAWARGGLDRFAEEQRIIEADMVAAPPNRLARARLAAARFYFANGFAAEALGYLRLAGEEEPTLVDTGFFRALRGAANVLMRRWNQAAFDLDNPLVKDDPEAQVWQAMAHAGQGEDPASLNKALAPGLALIKAYPKRLKWPIVVKAFHAAMAASDEGAAQAALDQVSQMAETPRERGTRSYLLGIYTESQGKFDRAVDAYVKAQETGDRETRARAALAEVELRLKTKTINLRDAEARLDRLRFAWRDEDFEFGLLRKVADIELKSARYPEALRALRSLANYYPTHKGAAEVTKTMLDTFAKLYLDGAADAMPPVTAIGLYDEFRDLTPPGAKGDEMIRRLADRLVSVDLLGRAAELLKHQVTYRLQGLEKSRVGTQLAVLDLLDQHPRDALDALTTSEGPGIPADLARQRQHLRANALSELGRPADAVALLANDSSPEAALLKAEIYWRNKDWPSAALAFSALVEKPPEGQTLDDASARLVLNWATALILANDEHGLSALRRTMGSAMDETPYKDGFRLLSSALDRDIPNLASVAQKIKEAEKFRTFLSGYKEKIEKDGVSAIN